MSLLANLSLRHMLTVPYVMLVLLLALIVGALSYVAGRDALDDLSGQLLTETVNRISQAVEQHVSGSAAVLETAFPFGVSAPEKIDSDFDSLRTRFWLATSVHLDPNNYAYYGNEEGQFFGLWRHSKQEGELRLRLSGEEPRTIYRFTDIQGDLKAPVQEDRIFDPRERPWYKAGQSQDIDKWTSIYIDFKTAELVATRARRVNDDTGKFAGVVATDLSLARVNDFLKGLSLSKNGVAYVVETDGNLIGASKGPNLFLDGDGARNRLNARDSEYTLVPQTYRAVKRLIGDETNDTRTDVVTMLDGSLVQVAYTRMADQAGLDWIIVVAVPRNDFLFTVKQTFRQTAVIGILACILVGFIGLAVLTALARELKELAAAAGEVGEGNLNTNLNTGRKDEIGDLARSFAQMQHKLLTDRLTGLANREALMRRIEERLVRSRRNMDQRPFGVLFVDFNRFKQINDRFGHDVGDQVIQELSDRLAGSVRSEDMVARYAGDEFVVLLESAQNRVDIERIRDEIEVALKQPLAALQGPDALKYSSGAAIGIAVYPDDGLDVETLIQEADQDMYKRKSSQTNSNLKLTHPEPSI